MVRPDPLSVFRFLPKLGSIIYLPLRSAWAIFFRPGLGPKEKLKFLPEPGPKQNSKSWPRAIFFPDFGPDRLGLSDLKNLSVQLLPRNRFIFGPARWKIQHSFASPALSAGKIIFRLLAWPSTLENITSHFAALTYLVLCIKFGVSILISFGDKNR